MEKLLADFIVWICIQKNAIHFFFVLFSPSIKKTFSPTCAKQSTGSFRVLASPGLSEPQ